MTDTWAAKVLAGVPRWTIDEGRGAFLSEAEVLTAIARMGAGDGLVERLNRADEYEPLGHDGWEAADRIAALTAQNREMALDVLASSGQAQEAYAAQLAAEAERDALRAKVTRLEGELTNLPAVYAHQINTGVREVYDPLQRFYTMESVLIAIAEAQK